jgi:hypothetical protein
MGKGLGVVLPVPNLSGARFGSTTEGEEPLGGSALLA